MRNMVTAPRSPWQNRLRREICRIFWQCPENNFGTVQECRLQHEPGAAGAALGAHFRSRESRVQGRRDWTRLGAVSGLVRLPVNKPVIVDLGTDWRLYPIDVTGRDLTRVISGFMFVTNTTQSPAGLRLYLDDIVWQ